MTGRIWGLCTWYVCRYDWLTALLMLGLLLLLRCWEVIAKTLSDGQTVSKTVFALIAISFRLISIKYTQISETNSSQWLWLTLDYETSVKYDLRLTYVKSIAFYANKTKLWFKSQECLEISWCWRQMSTEWTIKTNLVTTIGDCDQAMPSQRRRRCLQSRDKESQTH